MMTKWRVIKKATTSRYNYIGIEFDCEQAEMQGVKVYNRDTGVRKRTTSQFEVFENDSWEVISNHDTKGLIMTFNEARRQRGKTTVGEAQVLELLYKIERMT